MRATISSSQVTERISIPVLSSDGKNSWSVIVYESGISCSCPGFRFRAACRHVDLCRAWLEAVIPPRELPS